MHALLGQRCERAHHLNHSVEALIRTTETPAATGGIIGLTVLAPVVIVEITKLIARRMQ